MARDWYGQTVIHPIGIAAVIVLGILVLFLPKKYVYVPLFIMACFIAPAQRIVIGGLDFTFGRIIILFSWVRLLFRGEVRGFKLVRLDKLIIYYTIINTIVYTLLWMTSSALINRMGYAFDTILTYFFFRVIINDKEDVETIIKIFILISIPIVVVFFIEKTTGRNIFSIFGGVPEFTAIRAGRLRVQGAFAHPILAGCFWASLIPLIVSRFWQPEYSKLLTIIGLFNSTAVVIMSASSTPVMSVVFGIMGAFMFLLRYRMKIVRYGILLMLIGLDLVMKAPVWALFTRISGVVSGSTGYHRFNLINEAIKHFNEWWLLGTRTTRNWGRGLGDVTNQYIAAGVNGGIISLILFIIIIAVAFQIIGRLWRSFLPSREKVVFAWAIGVTLFMHAVNFLGVSYFGQIGMLWLLTLAICGSMSSYMNKIKVEN